MAQAANHKPLLDLDTLAPDRPTVRIRTKSNRRGKLYEIRTLDDLSLAERAEVGRLQRKVTELQPLVDAQFNGDSDPDEEIIDQFEEVIDRFLGLVFLRLEADLIAQLDLAHKEALMAAFIEASPPEMRQAAEAALKQIQAKQSPASKRSTTARRKPGSTSARQ